MTMITAIQTNALDDGTRQMQETAQSSLMKSNAISEESTSANTIQRCGVSFLLSNNKSVSEAGANNGIEQSDSVVSKEHTWFVCYECNSRFLTQEILDEHSVMHTGIFYFHYLI